MPALSDLSKKLVVLPDFGICAFHFFYLLLFHASSLVLLNSHGVFGCRRMDGNRKEARVILPKNKMKKEKKGLKLEGILPFSFFPVDFPYS